MLRDDYHGGNITEACRNADGNDAADEACATEQEHEDTAGCGGVAGLIVAFTSPPTRADEAATRRAGRWQRLSQTTFGNRPPREGSGGAFDTPYRAFDAALAPGMIARGEESAALFARGAPQEMATLPGSTVPGTSALEALTAAGHPILIDVAAPRPQKPAGLAENARSMPAPHGAIPGSVRLPAGRQGMLTPALASRFRARVGALGGSPDRVSVIYCHTRCKWSFGAAEHATGDGDRRVSWYPPGIEGSTQAGEPTALAKPLQPTDKRERKP